MTRKWSQHVSSNSIFDETFKESLKKIVAVESTEDIKNPFDKWLICTNCAQFGKKSYFYDIGSGFQPRNDLKKCHVAHHGLNKNHCSLIERKALDIQALLKKELTTFQKVL